MSTPTAATANTNSSTNNTDIVTAANSNFINDANVAIANAINLGQFVVYLNVIPPADMQTLANYFGNLGYDFALIPPSSGVNVLLGGIPYGPAELFGQNWINFWNSPMSLFPKNIPLQVKIAWATPGQNLFLAQEPSVLTYPPYAKSNIKTLPGPDMTEPL